MHLLAFSESLLRTKSHQLSTACARTQPYVGRYLDTNEWRVHRRRGPWGSTLTTLIDGGEKARVTWQAMFRPCAWIPIAPELPLGINRRVSHRKPVVAAADRARRASHWRPRLHGSSPPRYCVPAQ